MSFGLSYRVRERVPGFPFASADHPELPCDTKVPLAPGLTPKVPNCRDFGYYFIGDLPDVIIPYDFE
jgi:hypothetical protein